MLSHCSLCMHHNADFNVSITGYPSALPTSALKPRSSPNQRFNTPSSSKLTPRELAQTLLSEARTSGHLAQRRQETLKALERDKTVRDLERQAPRVWRAGDVYAPHDLSPVEAQKWRSTKVDDKDVFDKLGMNPLHEWKNVSILGSFVTPLGRLMHRNQTGLRAVNQRKISKAVRRAVGMGLMPSVHKHPEILEVEERVRNERRFGLDGSRGIVKQ